MTEEIEFLKIDPSFSTRAIHDASKPEMWRAWPLVPPISLSTTYKQEGPNELKMYEYARSGNATRECLQKCLASLEGAEHALAFPSGLATTTAIVHMLSAGDHVVSMDDLYGGTARYFRTIATRMGIEIDFVDATDVRNVEAAIKPNTKMIWIETPTNPTLKLVDIAAVTSVAQGHEGIFTVVDNTFMTSYFQQPLSFGADIVMHSLTNYMNGHSDVLMGAVCLNREDLYEKLCYIQNTTGPVPSPFDCYLVFRSLKTLAVRMQQHMRTGLAVARFLESHPCVEKVIHPCLPSHPQHELVKRQCSGYSGMVSFYIKGNDLEVSKNFFQKLKVITLAVSLGGCESVCELPSVMTHESVPKDHREKLGITDGLIRLSCGLESSEDLIHDLDQALKAVVPH